MPVIRPVPFSLGLLALVLVWMGPLPPLAALYFSAHMTMHMGVVAVAAPLLALGLREWPAAQSRVIPAAVPASCLELVVVWVWHSPALHHAARQSAWALWAEQTLFLASALLVWVVAFATSPRHSSGAGVVALLLTSMHMTLLGALFALSSRVLYPHVMQGPWGMTPLEDQHLGGTIMLVAGGLSYMAGGL
ncbi:MAG: cytochrome c oxidase assembly protein, partial [Vicinamibacterales bacterium]